MDRITVITSNIAPYRLRWCEELARHYGVTVVYTKDHDYERDDRWLQKQSESCEIIKLKNDRDKYDALCFDVIGAIRKDPEALIIFDGYGPKTNLLGLLYCRLTKRFSYTNVDGYPLGESSSKLKLALKRFIISRLCTGFFCSSEETRQHLIENGAKAENVHVHNFSSITKDMIIEKPLTEKQKQEVRKELGIETDKPIVISVGAFIPRKRYEDLIRAVNACKSDCELYLIGGKPTSEYLRLAKGRRNIHFIGFVMPDQVYRYYLAADLFVLPSQTDVWGLVINEAMAEALPVISSDNCVAAFSLVKDNGVIYRTGNIDELREAIDRCLDPKNRETMAENSLKIISDYTIEGMVERQLPVIREYFGNKS